MAVLVRQRSLADHVIILGDGKLRQVDDLAQPHGDEEALPDFLLKKLGHPVELETMVSPEVTGESVVPGHASKQKPQGSKVTALGPKKQIVGTREKSTYRFYLKPVGALRVAVLLTAVVLLAFSTRFQRIWVGWWTEAAPSLEAMYIGVYFLLAVGACMCFMFFFW